MKLSEAKEHGSDLLNINNALHTMQEAMDNMIFMEWKDKPKDDSLKITISPEARNAYMGAMRLLTAVDPIIAVPHDKNDAVASEHAESIEKMCKAIWYQSGRIGAKPVHYDLVGSLLRYGQFHLAITDTDDLVKAYEKMGKGVSKATRLRYDRIAKATPYVFQPLDPKCGNAEFDSFGLTAYYREVEMTYAELIGMFGKRKEWKDKNPTEFAVYKDYWNLDVHYGWVDEESEPLIGYDNDGKHDLPCIPIIVQGGEGTKLNTEPEYQFQPFLFGAWKGELWERHNLELTVMYSNLFAVAANALFLHKRSEPDSQIEVDFDNIGGIIHLNPGDDLVPLQRDILNKDMLYGLDVAERLFSESTMFKQALGEPMSKGTAYSTVALLSQSGRLPLIATQRTGGWGIGTAFELMFDMIKDKKQKRTAVFDSGLLDIDPAELPENLIIDVTLDAELPQDKLQQANIAGMLKQYGLASDGWIRENILNIGQSKDMTKEVLGEQYVQKMMQEHFTGAMKAELQKQIMAEMQAQQQQQMQQQQMAQQQQQAQQMQMAKDQQRQAIGNRRQMAAQIEEQTRFAEQNAPNMGGVPAIVGRGAIPAQRPGQKPTIPNQEAGGLQEGE
jgi:hypothetical protein